MNDYREYRRDVQQAAGEAPFLGWQLFKIILVLMILGTGVSVVGYGLGWFGEAAQVARKEFGPSAALKKYEWFKNAAAELDAKKANIETYQGRLTAMEKSYAGTPRAKWDRTDREQLNLWENEVAGAKASYNSLAAEWNAQISKFNWKSFQGDLPEGSSELLSRNFAPYQVG